MKFSSKCHPLWLPLSAAAILVSGFASMSADAADLGRHLRERPAHANAYQDGLPLHAGGAYGGQLESLHGHRGKAAAACRDGTCGDHCVARPDRFGFYETRWRPWPGTAVVQATALEELTPAPPARLELPSEEEESRNPEESVEFGVDQPVEEDESEADATTLPGLEPWSRPAPDAAPDVPSPPSVPAEPSPQPAEEPKREEPTPPPARSDEENLFDDGANLRRLRERLAIVRAVAASTAADAPTSFAEPEGAKPLQEPRPKPRWAAPANGVRPVSVGQGHSRAHANPLRPSSPAKGD